MNASDDRVLDVSHVSRHFGGIKALEDISFSLKKGSITSLIGPNGAGKTTFINVVTGIHFPDAGRILFQGEDIAGLPAHAIASKGIGRTFQLEDLFGSLTALENTMVGCHVNSRSGMLACGFALPGARREEKEIEERAMENLRIVGLGARAHDPVTRLPLGERKLVGVARALSMMPALLMLDEPVGGLDAHEIGQLMDLIHKLADLGLTVFIVEHNMRFVMALSEKVVVLDEGVKIAEGPPEEVRTNPEVIKAYLGEEVCHE